MTYVKDCLFCKIANDYPDTHIVYECSDLIAFLDTTPIRESHTQIVTKKHFEYFDDLPPIISHKIIDLGQKIAKAQKTIYPVERAGFLFTGGDIAHVHAHVLPLYENSDITSLRYAEGSARKVEFDTLVCVTERLKVALGKIG